MIKSGKATGKATSMPLGVMIGAGISLVMTGLVSLILAKLISAEKMEWEQIGYGILCMLVFAAMIGSKMACGLVKRRKVLVCMVVAGLYWLNLLLLTALFFGGQYSGMGVTAAVIFCGSGLVCMQEMKEGKGRYRQNKRKINIR